VDTDEFFHSFGPPAVAAALQFHAEALASGRTRMG